MGARIQAVAGVVPERMYKQGDVVATFFARLPGWRPEWEERFAAATVERRGCVVDLEAFYLSPNGEPARPTTEVRMRAFGPAARQLAARAARGALERAGTEGRVPVSTVVAVSCTGYAGPGLDAHVVEDLSLPASTHRLAIGHMGCYAALPALRTAAALTSSGTGPALVVCTELCSLHVQPARSTADAVSQALFGDGAAAAVLSCEGPGLEVVDAATWTAWTDSSRMTWEVGDQGFAMWLSPRVPALVAPIAERVVDELLAAHGLRRAQVAHWVLHPGGPEIVERLGRRLAVPERDQERALGVLADGGNRSSATVLFVLEALLQEGMPSPGEWVVALAFGTGLTCEVLLLRSVR